MGLADLLGDPFGMTVQYADGTSAPAQASPQAAPQAAPQAQTYQPPHGIKAFLGMLGDAMLTAHGLPPAYQNRVNQERENAALSGFLTNPDQAIQQLMQIDPKSGIQLYSQVHPKSEIPEGVREYSYYSNLPDAQKPAFEKFLQLTHPGMMAPYTMGPGDTLQMPSSAGSTATMPTVATPQEAAKLPPGSKFRLPDGRIGTVPGGATASNPSATFPGR